jgi:hypothetical protein
VLVLIALVMALGAGVMIARRRLLGRPATEDHQAGLMESLRAMRDRGEMTPAEFEAARRAMIERIRGTRADEAGGTRGAGSRAASAGDGGRPALPAGATPRTGVASPAPVRVAPAGDPARETPAAPKAAPARAEAKPGFDLTGRPLPEPARAGWQWALTILACAMPFALLADLGVSLATRARGVLWAIPSFLSGRDLASGAWVFMGMAAGCVLIWIVGGLTLGARGRGAPAALVWALIGVGAAAPVLAHLGTRLEVPAAWMRAAGAADHVGHAVLSRGLVESLVAGAIVLLAGALCWIARRRFGVVGERPR